VRASTTTTAKQVTEHILKTKAAPLTLEAAKIESTKIKAALTLEATSATVTSGATKRLSKLVVLLALFGIRKPRPQFFYPDETRVLFYGKLF
jgi:hypothetical protein